MYLAVFNVVSAVGWALVALRTLVGIATNPAPPPLVAHNAFSTQLVTWLRPIPPTHALSWPILAPVQSLAVLEILHALLRLVKSPFPTTLAQVSSRLILVWAIVARFPCTHASPIYTTMVLAWSISEVPRYSYYALGLLGVHPPPWLTWLRYSTFYVLYPLGAGSEALLALSTISEWQHGWSLEDWLKAAMILIWIPGLYVMYTYMIHTRRKVLGPHKAQKRDAKPKDRLKAN